MPVHKRANRPGLVTVYTAFGQLEARVEAYLMDYSGSLGGQRVGLHLLTKIREQVHFAGPDELVAQLGRDVERARGFAPRLAQMRSEPIVPL